MAREWTTAVMQKALTAALGGGGRRFMAIVNPLIP